MNASERLRALDEKASDITIGFMLGVDDGGPSPWPPNIAVLEEIRRTLPLIADCVEEAEKLDEGCDPSEPLGAALTALREHLEGRMSAEPLA